MFNAEITEAWEDISNAGNDMLVLEWEYWILETPYTVRQYLLNKIPASAALLRRLLRQAGRTYDEPASLVGLRAWIDVDESGDWPSVTQVKPLEVGE